MNRSMIAVAIVGALLFAGCGTDARATPLPGSASEPTMSGASALVSPVPMAGGCGETQVFAGPGPDAALGLSDNPWAFATPPSAGVVAYFWDAPPHLLYASGPRDEPSKILWVGHGSPVRHLLIRAHPYGSAAPLLLYDVPAASAPANNYPAGLDLPTPGCWHLDITLGDARVLLDVLVAPARVNAP